MNSGAIWGVGTQSVKMGDDSATFGIDTVDSSKVFLRVDHADGSSTQYNFDHNGPLLSTVETPTPVTMAVKATAKK
jgi:hypothetical protein